ncbi:MAG: hypothetical protein E7551_01545 [Ruminococcaceae bacterium]|nr:hypothetical protein [Oscillospiraceae bacterium]
MNDYSYLLVGGDTRQKHLYKSLLNKNIKVDSIFLFDENNLSEDLEKISNANVIILPIPSTADGTTLFAPLIESKIELAAIIERISKNTILFIGGDNNIFITSKAKKVINVLSDEVMTLKNAMATAEATLAIIIDNTEHTIFGSNILITGYGRIGKILTDYLIALKANVTVCARSKIARTSAELSGANTIGFDRLKDSLNKYKIIINTVPMLIFKQEELKNIKSDTLIIDLASKPGGIDFNAAKYMGLKTIHALSLPGKYSPQTAAEFIENAINNTLI